MPAHSRFPRVPGALLTRRLAVGALCVTSAGAAALGISLHPNPAHSGAPASASAAALATARLDALTRANRSTLRIATPAATPATTAPPAATPAAPAPKPTVAKTDLPLPAIRGYTKTQVANAWTIVLEGHRMGVNQRGQQIAIATAMQESNLYNLKRAVDHDSLGLFQQRPSSGWGTPAQVTNPTYAAHAFYSVLLKHKSTWGVLWRAAQTVQGSAFPYAYQKHASAALALVKILDQRFS